MKTTKRIDSKKSLGQTGGHRVIAGTKLTSRQFEGPADSSARAMADALEAILRAESRNVRA